MRHRDADGGAEANKSKDGDAEDDGDKEGDSGTLVTFIGAVTKCPEKVP